MRKPLRGFKDIIFIEGNNFQKIINLAYQTAQNYGYQIGHFPILESTDLFARTLGDSSDIVTKEMYSFKDRNDESVTMRPEFTAIIARSVISNSLYHQLPFKIFSYGPLFRYERPQRGRFRQFHQLNFENLGVDSINADLDILMLINNLITNLDIKDKLQLEINNLGCDEARARFSNNLVEYLNKYANDLSQDSQKRLKTNPLRILDSKSEQDQDLLNDAPHLADFLSIESKNNFEQILLNLSDNNIAYKINQKLVRGLDYYSNLVFEFTTDLLGSQNAVFAGGRYNKLFNILNAKQEVPAVGAASGIERLLELVNFKENKIYKLAIIPFNNEYLNSSVKLAENLRANNISCQIAETGKNLGKIIKKIESNSENFLILGEDEEKSKEYKVKNLANSKENIINGNELVRYLIS